jgi:hypothetical protein
MSDNNSRPSSKTKGHSVIYSGDNKRVLYDSDKDKSDFKSGSTIFSADGKRILHDYTKE